MKVAIFSRKINVGKEGQVGFDGLDKEVEDFCKDKKVKFVTTAMNGNETGFLFIITVVYQEEEKPKETIVNKSKLESGVQESHGTL